MTDPILAVIERHRGAIVELARVACGDDAAAEKAAIHGLDDALDALLVGRPTTLVGAVSLLDYYADQQAIDEGWNYTCPDGVSFHEIFIRNLARSLERLTV